MGAVLVSWQLVCAVAVAVGVPLFFVIVRHEVRFARLRALFEFDQLFEVSRSYPTGDQRLTQTDARPGDATASTPTYEYVRARYTDDIEFPEHFPQAWIKSFDMSQAPFRDFIRGLQWWGLKSSRSILFAGLPYMVIVGLGLTLILACLSDRPVCGIGGFGFPLCANELVAGGVNAHDAALLAENVSIVAATAFLGGLVFSLLLFLRALATFDLSPLTMLRATIYIAVGTLMAVLIYRAAPDPVAQSIDAWRAVSHEIAGPASPPPAHSARPASSARTVPDAAKAAPSEDQVKPLSRLWFAAAFLLGFIPDMALGKMTSLVQGWLNMKSADDNLTRISKSTPLEVIDGIDVLTRFRLQESNIFEVQNLAVSNPVMLFVETPYGIYEVIDWVAQAQLCTAVGPERFFELRRNSIRTVFDLERAVLSVYTTSELRRYVASILLAPAPATANNTPAILRFLGLGKTPKDPATAPRDGDQFAEYAAALFSKAATASDGVNPAADPDESIKHLVRIIVDDLHVCRLRQVWLQILTKIDNAPPPSTSSVQLPDTQPPTPPKPPASA